MPPPSLARTTPAPRPSPARQAPRRRCWPATSATAASPTPSTCGPSPPSPPRPAPAPTTTPAGQPATGTTKPYELSATASSASSTVASSTTPPTRRPSPGRTAPRASSEPPLDISNRGMSRPFRSLVGLGRPAEQLDAAGEAGRVDVGVRRVESTLVEVHADGRCRRGPEQPLDQQRAGPAGEVHDAVRSTRAAELDHGGRERGVEGAGQVPHP